MAECLLVSRGVVPYHDDRTHPRSDLLSTLAQEPRRVPLEGALSCRFEFAEINTNAAHFVLAVSASIEFEAAVSVASHEVADARHLSFVAIKIAPMERFCRQLAVTPVTERHPGVRDP